jgi:hypothetical protein
MDVKLNEHTSEFMADFFAFGPAVELLKTVGRNVSGADFGHSTSSVFQGTYALGIHQTGSGAVLPVWAACFGGQWRNENGESWNYCGACILKAGLQPLYPLGHINFTDRHKGVHYFGSAISGMISLHCTKHIPGMISLPTAQKSFHGNMVWALQGSKSVGEYYVHLAKFNANYPDVKVHYIFLVSVVIHDTGYTDVESVVRVRKAYLEQIPNEDWVHCAQVAHGAHTYSMAGARQTWRKSVWHSRKK